MIEENSNYVLVEDMEQEGTLIGSVMYKPYVAIVVSAIVGVLFILTGNWIAIIAGIVFFGIVILVYVNVKDRKTVDVYDEYLILYHTDEPEYGRRIDYYEIAEWTIKNGSSSSDSLMIRLKDGEVIYKDTFLSGKVYRYVNKAIPQLETRYLQAEENKKKKLKFRWPFKKKNADD